MGVKDLLHRSLPGAGPYSESRVPLVKFWWMICLEFCRDLVLFCASVDMVVLILVWGSFCGMCWRCQILYHIPEAAQSLYSSHGVLSSV